MTALGLGLTLLHIGSASASAAPRYTLFVQDSNARGWSGEPELGSYAAAEAYDSGPDGSEWDASVRLVVLRDGVRVVDERSEGSRGFQSAEAFDYAPREADVLQLYSPADAPAPSKSHVYEALPSMVRCNAGTFTVTGRLPPAGVEDYATDGALLTDPTVPPQSPANPNPGPAKRDVMGSITRSGDRYVATFPRTISPIDRIAVGNRRDFGNLSVGLRTERTGGSCPGDDPPPMPPPGWVPPGAPSPAALVPTPTAPEPAPVAADDPGPGLPSTGRVRIATARPVVAADARTVRLGLTCLGSGTDCAGEVRLRSSGRATSSVRRFTLQAGRTRTFRTRLSRSGEQRLRTSGRLRVEAVVTSAVAGGVARRAWTLRAPRRSQR